MRGIHYKRRDPGRRLRGRPRFRPSYKDRALELREKMVEAVAETDDAAAREVPVGRGDHQRGAQAGAAPRHHRQPDPAGDLRQRLQATRACSRCSTRWSTTCRRRSTIRPIEGIDPDNDQTVKRTLGGRPSRSPALVFKIMTDPFVGQLAYFRVYSGKVETGDSVLNATTRQDRAHRPPPQDARQQARGDRPRSGPATSPPRWASRTSPPATPSATRSAPIVLEAMNFPEPVICGLDRAQDEGRPGEALGHRSAS